MLSRMPSFFPRLVQLKNGRVPFSVIGLLAATAIAWVLIPAATESNFILFALIGLVGVAAVAIRYGWLALVIILIALPEVQVPRIAFDVPIAMPVALMVFGIKALYRGKWTSGGIGVLFVLFILAQLVSWLAAQSTYFTGLDQLEAIANTSIHLSQNRVLWQVGGWVLGFGVFLFVANQMHSSADVMLLSKLIIVVGLVVAAYGIYEYAAAQLDLPYIYPSVDKFGQIPRAAIGYQGELFPRIYSSFQEPKLLGRFLLIPLFLALSTWTVTKSNRLVIVCAIILAAIIMTFSTTAWVGLVVGFGVWAYLSGIYKRPELIRAAIPMAVALAAAGIIIASVVLGGSSAGSRVFNLHTARLTGIATNKGDVSSDYIEGWTLGLRLFKASPVTGVGIGNSPFYSGITKYVFTPFSLYILILAETGLVGFAVFMAFLAAPVRKAWKAIRATSSSPELAAASAILVGAIAAFAAGIPTYAAFGGARFYLEDWVLIAIMARGATLIAREVSSRRAV